MGDFNNSETKGYRVFTKLFFTHTTVALVSVVSLSVLFYLLFREALIQRTMDQLSSINILKKNHIDEYFDKTQSTLQFQLEHDLSNQRQFLTPEGLKALNKIYGFESILVVDSNRTKIASTENDSLLTIAVSCLATKLLTRFQTFDAYSCIGDKETFIVYALPIMDGGNPIATIFIQENFEKIQAFLLETTGMGTTGESYLVGPNFRMRSRSRFGLPPDTPMKVESRMTAEGEGDVISDYRGIKVLSVYRKINNPDLAWTLISEIDFDEALKPLARWRNYIVLTTLLITIIIVAITYSISNSISNPILHLKTIITGLSKGIIPNEKVNTTDTTEVGQIAQAISELIEGLKRTTEFANEIGAGKFTIAYTTLSDQDSLGLSLIGMRDKLKKLSEEQIKLVREKASALLEGQENERKRIVQELHDGVGQLLTGIRLRVQGLDLNEPVREEILGLINETIAEVKRISYNVMPNSIVDFGLEAALRGLCDNVRKSTTLNIDYQYIKESEHSLRFEVSIAVFRIVQEGFNNIMKHANATQVDLHVVASEQELYFLLKDNGKGFDINSPSLHAGLGLHGMKERARLLDGNLEIHSSPEGTIVEARIPVI
jgi:signal transduction histidine kinase